MLEDEENVDLSPNICTNFRSENNGDNNKENLHNNVSRNLDNYSNNLDVVSALQNNVPNNSNNNLESPINDNKCEFYTRKENFSNNNCNVESLQIENLPNNNNTDDNKANLPNNNVNNDYGGTCTMFLDNLQQQSKTRKINNRKNSLNQQNSLNQDNDQRKLTENHIIKENSYEETEVSLRNGKKTCDDVQSNRGSICPQQRYSIYSRDDDYFVDVQNGIEIKSIFTSTSFYLLSLSFFLFIYLFFNGKLIHFLSVDFPTVFKRGLLYKGIYWPSLTNSFQCKHLELAYLRYSHRQRQKSLIIVNIVDLCLKVSANRFKICDHFLNA